VGAFFNAAVLLTFALFNQELRNAFLWLMGNLSTAQMESLLIAGPLTLAGVALGALDVRRFNLIATGEETAAQLGVNIARCGSARMLSHHSSRAPSSPSRGLSDSSV